eukprot:GHVU01039048.1.p1 GENE.GHVU01039048.1~~GHVU01039048.1.p1  ORF type:complete len:534 (-),score=43.33 GHVU01039048.1:3074-4675(-)
MRQSQPVAASSGGRLVPVQQRKTCTGLRTGGAELVPSGADGQRELRHERGRYGRNETVPQITLAPTLRSGTLLRQVHMPAVDATTSTIEQCQLVPVALPPQYSSCTTAAAGALGSHTTLSSGVAPIGFQAAGARGGAMSSGPAPGWFPPAVVRRTGSRVVVVDSRGVPLPPRLPSLHMLTGTEQPGGRALWSMGYCQAHGRGVNTVMPSRPEDWYCDHERNAGAGRGTWAPTRAPVLSSDQTNECTVRADRATLPTGHDGQNADTKRRATVGRSGSLCPSGTSLEGTWTSPPMAAATTLESSTISKEVQMPLRSHDANLTAHHAFTSLPDIRQAAAIAPAPASAAPNTPVIAPTTHSPAAAVKRAPLAAPPQEVARSRSSSSATAPSGNNTTGDAAMMKRLRQQNGIRLGFSIRDPTRRPFPRRQIPSRASPGTPAGLPTSTPAGLPTGTPAVAPSSPTGTTAATATKLGASIKPGRHSFNGVLNPSATGRRIAAPSAAVTRATVAGPAVSHATRFALAAPEEEEDAAAHVCD